MTRITPQELISALRAEGVRTLPVTRNGKSFAQNTSAGRFDPYGIMNHHTAMNSKRIKPGHQVALLWDGRPGLDGPLCHIALGRKGTAYLVGWNNANHAGLGDSSVLNAIFRELRLNPPTRNDADGNEHFWGIEVMNDGIGEPYPPEQIEALVKINAAIIRATNDQGVNWTEKSTLHHREWSNRKIDMSYSHSLRPMIKACLALPPGKWQFKPASPVAKSSKAKSDSLRIIRRSLKRTKSERRTSYLKRIRKLWRKVK